MYLSIKCYPERRQRQWTHIDQNLKDIWRAMTHAKPNLKWLAPLFYISLIAIRAILFLAMWIALEMAVGLSSCLSVPQLWPRLKYLNNYWIDFHVMEFQIYINIHGLQSMMVPWLYLWRCHNVDICGLECFGSYWMDICEIRWWSLDFFLWHYNKFRIPVYQLLWFMTQYQHDWKDNIVRHQGHSLSHQP